MHTFQPSRFLRLLAVLALGASAANAAQPTAPDALVKSVASEVIEIIKRDPAIQGGDPRRISEVVESKILPHFDFSRMTALALGINWRKASPEQQKRLTEEFKTLLVRTYSSGLSAYRNQVIDYKPLRARPEDTDVTVRSEVKQSGAQAVAIDYAMEKKENGWKVYDVSIGGISLVTTYRDSFAQEVRSGGVDGLIQSLADKNKAIEAASRK